MRVDLLTVGPADDQAAIRFHARLTVVGGLDAPARRDFGLLMVRALFGGADELWGSRWVDSSGDVYVGLQAPRGWVWRTTDGDDAETPRRSSRSTSRRCGA